MVPTVAVSAPCSVVTRSGQRVWGGRRPGPYSAGWPSSRLKPRPRLWRLMPEPGSTSQLPKPAALDWMSETAIRSSSTAHR